MPASLSCPRSCPPGAREAHPALLCSPLQAPAGDLRAAEPAEARDRSPVPPPGQDAAPQPGALAHGPPCRPPEEGQQEQAEGWEAADSTGAAAQGRGLQHRLALCPAGGWAGGWAGGGRHPDLEGRFFTPHASGPWGCGGLGPCAVARGEDPARELQRGGGRGVGARALQSRGCSSPWAPPCRVLPGRGCFLARFLDICHLLTVGAEQLPWGRGRVVGLQPLPTTPSTEVACGP